MSQANPEQDHSPESPEENRSSFQDKLRELLSDIEFEETDEMVAARTAILEALGRQDGDPAFLQSVWQEYDLVIEEMIKSRTPSGIPVTPQLRTAVLLHKALIFREAGNYRHYKDELEDVVMHAHNTYLDETAYAIEAEIEHLSKT